MRFWYNYIGHDIIVYDIQFVLILCTIILTAEVRALFGGSIDWSTITAVL